MNGAPHTLGVADTFEKYNVNKQTGMTQSQVEEALLKYGYNELPAEEGKSLLKMILEQFDDLLVRYVKCVVVLSSVPGVLHSYYIR